MSYYIEDEHKWRVSRSGFSVKTGMGDSTRIVCHYHGNVSPLDHAAFEQWTLDAMHICDLHNATLQNAQEGRHD